MSSIDALVAAVATALVERHTTLATAESCTGGLVAAACTARPGSSAWFERGLVTYSNAAKSELLDVAPALIARHGAVSAEVARAMAEGLLARAPASFTLAITGIAGPDGGTPAKPVGTVWIATASRGSPAEATLLQVTGDRDAVREQAVIRALELLRAHVETTPVAGSAGG
jgi:nicotinamide-nucleotide amidase